MHAPILHLLLNHLLLPIHIHPLCLFTYSLSSTQPDIYPHYSVVTIILKSNPITTGTLSGSSVLLSLLIIAGKKFSDTRTNKQACQRLSHALNVSTGKCNIMPDLDITLVAFISLPRGRQLQVFVVLSSNLTLLILEIEELRGLPNSLKLNIIIVMII